MRRVLAILPVVLAVLAVPSCSEEPNPGGGGFRTARWLVQQYVADLKLAACGGDKDPGAFQAEGSLPITDGIVSRLASADADLLTDVLEAETCDEALAALNHGEPPAACDKDEKGTCVDNVASRCRKFGDRWLRIRSDCGAADLSCFEGECGLGECTSGSCDDDALNRCDGAAGERIECGYLGLTCGRGGEGLQCTGTGAECFLWDPEDKTGLKTQCDSGVLTMCLGGRVALIDCAALTEDRRACNQAWLNDHLETKPEEIAEKHLTDVCAPAGTECEEGTSSCEGTILRLCVDGFRLGMDCTDAKFAGCSTKDGRAFCSDFPAP